MHEQSASTQMSTPPGSTVIFSNVPDQWTVGVDVHFFNTTPAFKGVKLIEPGIRCVHWAQGSTSVRYGFYFEAREGDVHVLYWDHQNEKMLIDEEVGEINVNREKERLPEYYPYMVSLPLDEHWQALTQYIQPRQLAYILPTQHNRMDSVLTSTDENNTLLQAITSAAEQRHANISNDPIVNSIIDQSEEEIKYTPIDLTKSIRPNSTPQEKTHDGLDKSWYLQHLITTSYNGNGDLLLGEFQLSFISMLIFANYSSGLQWLKFMRVLFYCHDIIPQRPQLYEKFLISLCLMLDKLPEDYGDEFVDESFFQVSVGELEYTLKELNLHRLVRKVMDLKGILSSKFGIHVHGIVEDEEDAPVIVDL